MTSRNIAQHIGEKIKETRETNRISQEKLGELTDISRTHMERIERGLINLPIFTLYKIAKGLTIIPKKVKVQIILLSIPFAIL